MFSLMILVGLDDSFVRFSVLLSEGVISKDCLIALKFNGFYFYMYVNYINQHLIKIMLILKLITSINIISSKS